MRLVAVTVAVLMIMGNNMLAQEAKVEDASARELAKLNATMREVADLLTKQVAQGQLDLLMKRTQMATDQAERVDAQLRQAQDERASVEAQRSRLQSQRDMTVQEKMPEAERDVILAGIDPALKRLAARQSTLEGQIGEVQNRIAERQDELRGWQALLDRRLSGQ
jgi:chromosome segregation ATPase